jgi:hypothetical protein
MIIHLNGWPGVGKLTIGGALAHRLGARLIDNHLLHDVAIRCAGLRDPDRWPLYESVRSAAYAVLARRPASEVFVMTNGLCIGHERELKAWNYIVDLAINRNVPLVPIVLSADIHENVRRVESAERFIRKKLRDGAFLRELVRSDELQRPDVPELIELDVTRLSAEEAVERIIAEIAIRSAQGLQTASDGHRRLKTPAHVKPELPLSTR